MKKLLAWIALTAWSYTATSQNLTPKVQWLDKDTVFCFNMTQTRILAKHLEHGRYCDSLLFQSEVQTQQLYQLQSLSDSMLRAVTQKAANQDRIVSSQQIMISDINLRLEQSENKLKNQRWQKCVFIITTVALSAWLIVK